MVAKIYKISNDINNKIYVGQTKKTIQQRFDRHCAEARWKNTKNMPIVLAISKYGSHHFRIDILEECPDESPQDYIDSREVHWSQILNTLSPNGYNLRVGNASGLLSEETRKKISKAHLGKKASPETIERLRLSHLGFKVKEETKRKLSIINKGKKLTQEHIEKIRNSNTGRVLSAEVKEKMRLKKLKFHYTITSPSGVKYKTNNLQQFSKIHNLNPGHMNNVSTGRSRHYKQWKVKRVPLKLLQYDAD